MFKVFVAPDKISARYAEEYGFWWVEQAGDLRIDIYEFDTKAEAEAFCKGIGYGAGWDQPYYEIKSA
jgi:hypothetical protein